MFRSIALGVVFGLGASLIVWLLDPLIGGFSAGIARGVAQGVFYMAVGATVVIVMEKSRDMPRRRTFLLTLAVTYVGVLLLFAYAVPGTPALISDSDLRLREAVAGVATVLIISFIVIFVDYHRRRRRTLAALRAWLK